MDNFPNPEPWKNLYGAHRHVLACATVIEEIQPFLPDDVSFETLDFGLHLRPEGLRKVLQEKIDEASNNAEVLLLGIWIVFNGCGWLAGKNGSSCHPSCG